jgi:hypothetical protein
MWWALATFEDENQFMLRAVEGAYAPVVFGPDAQVEQRIVGFAVGSQQLFHMRQPIQI